MGSTERDIRDRSVTDLSAINGSGGYDYDFSGADAVQIGMTVEPHRVPAAYIFPLLLSTTQSPGKTPLRRYDRELKVQIDVYVPTTGAETGNASKAALDAQDDIMLALEQDRSLGSTGVHDIEIEASAYDGAELDRPGLGVATLLLTITYSETGGA